MRVPDANRVAEALGGAQRLPLDVDAFVKTAAPVQERRQGPDQRPYGTVVTTRDGVREQVEQDGAFGVEPGQGLRTAGELLRGRARLRRGQVDGLADAVDLDRAGVRGVQVVVQAAARGGGPVRRAVRGLRLLEGVGAEQVVERVPARLMLGHHVGAGQLAQRGRRLRLGHPGQAGRGGHDTSGPGCRPSNRNIHAAGSLSCSYDQDSTARTSVAASPASSASSRFLVSRSSAASAASEKPGRVAARPAATPRASGSRAHSAISSAAGCGSAARTSGPNPAAQ